MGEDIFIVVKDLLSQNVSSDDIRNNLVKKGFLESEIEDAVEKASLQMRLMHMDNTKKVARSLAWKEVLDRIGYGFVSHPFLNILFSFTGASNFLIGLINVLRTVFSLLYSSFMKEFSNVHILRKSFISRSGMLYGFSFLALSFAVVIRSPILYSAAFLIGSFGVVAHGELYGKFLSDHIRKERMGKFLAKISSFGIMITVVSLLISGYIMDFFPISGRQVSLNLFGNSFTFNIYGYLVSFEITALAFILSGLVLSLMKAVAVPAKATMLSFIGEFATKMRTHSRFFTHNKLVMLLTLSSAITGLVQLLGNSFYGIFIYNEFKTEFLGGFMNVAVIFAIAVIFSFIGPWFTKSLRHQIGISPMLVFGALLTAMLPLSLVYNPHLIVVGVATALSIIGSSILGMAQGFFTMKLLPESERKIYFSFVGVAVSLPLLIFAPIGAYIGDVYGLIWLFKILIILLVFVATPVYFMIVILYERSLQKPF